MAPLAAAPAASAATDSDVEAAAKRLLFGELLLVLVSGPIEFDLPAAPAAIGKRGGEHLVYLLGGRPGSRLGFSRENGAAWRFAFRRSSSILRSSAAMRFCWRSPLGAQAGVLSFELVVASYEAGELDHRPREAGRQRGVRWGGASETTFTAVDISPAGTR